MPVLSWTHLEDVPMLWVYPEIGLTKLNPKITELNPKIGLTKLNPKITITELNPKIGLTGQGFQGLGFRVPFILKMVST